MKSATLFPKERKHFAKSYRAKYSLLNDSAATHPALGNVRKEFAQESNQGFYSCTGCPIEAHHVFALKREQGAKGFKQKLPNEIPIETICLAPGFGLFASSYPQAPGPIPETRPQPRNEEKQLFFHPLGMKNLASESRYLPGINANIEKIAAGIHAEHYSPEDPDVSTLPRYMKAQKAAAVYGDLRSEIAKIPAGQKRPTLESKPTASSPVGTGLSDGAGDRPRTVGSDLQMSVKSGHSCFQEASRRHSDAGRARPSTGAGRSAAPPSMVPEIMDFLSSTGFRGLKKSGSASALRGL